MAFSLKKNGLGIFKGDTMLAEIRGVFSIVPFQNQFIHIYTVNI
jgi:hypothetical protein